MTHGRSADEAAAAAVERRHELGRRLDAWAADKELRPRPRRRRSRLYMYAIRAGDRGGPIKLGTAGDPHKRLQNLQTANPEELHLLAMWKTDSTADEWAFHERFAAQRIRGEWFAHSDELIETIEERVS